MWCLGCSEMLRVAQGCLVRQVAFSKLVAQGVEDVYSRMAVQDQALDAGQA